MESHGKTWLGETGHGKFMLKIKVHQGTKQDRHLCQTCSHAHVIQGQRDGEQTQYCRVNMTISDGATPIEIKFKVAECNLYREHDSKQLNELEQQATYLIRLQSGRWVGLHVGQYKDHNFMQALRNADGPRDYEKEALEFLSKGERAHQSNQRRLHDGHYMGFQHEPTGVLERSEGAGKAD